MTPTTRLATATKIGFNVQKNGDTTKILPALKALGSMYARFDAPINQSDYAFLLAMAQGGAKCIVGINGWEDKAMVDTQVGFIRQALVAVPGCLAYAAGPNEVNNNPQTFNGVTDAKDGNVAGHTSAMAIQDYIVSSLGKDATFAGIPILNYTDSTPPAARSGSLPDIHVYDNSTPNGPLGWWMDSDGASKLAKTNPSATRTFMTEVGTAQATETLATEYMVQAIATAYEMGLEMADVYAVSDYNSQTYGMYDGSWNIKARGTAVAAMLAELADAGSASFVAKSLGVTITDPSGDIRSVLVPKSDGTYVLMIWTYNPQPAFTFNYAFDRAMSVKLTYYQGAQSSKWSASANVSNPWTNYTGSLIRMDLS